MNEKEIMDFFKAMDDPKAVLPFIDGFKGEYSKLKEIN